MKKFLALLIAAALILALAACGKTEKDNASEPDTNDTVSAAPQSDKETEAETETDTLTDEAPVEELKEKITGEWGFPGDGSSEDIEHLTFNADGTGTYRALPDKNYTFHYMIHIDHTTYGNGEPYVENMFKIDYDTGESEDFIFFFTDEGKLAFHNSENGGYSGVMSFIDAYTKVK